jgi:hypothetical protein
VSVDCCRVSSVSSSSEDGLCMGAYREHVHVHIGLDTATASSLARLLDLTNRQMFEVVGAGCHNLKVGCG